MANEHVHDDHDDFEKSGPTLPPSFVDWTSTEYRRIAAACLVQSTYILETERGNGRTPSLAPPWWEFFHFEMEKTIEDYKKSIIGAIFQYKPHSHDQSLGEDEHAPRFVVAFRGTIIKKHSFVGDFVQDFYVFMHSLHKHSRYKTSISAVDQELVSKQGNSSSRIWLAGHSLGSSIATAVGKTLVVDQNIRLECFLFNPPFVSNYIDMVKCEKTKKLLCSWKKRLMGEEKFVSPDAWRRKLSSWTPNLFVNPKDLICCGYISYFQNSQISERLPVRRCSRAKFVGLFKKEADPLHLLPSGNLIINNSNRINEAHGIKQWWKADTDLNLNHKLYK